jgi:REP element-mobilizing transposase RayT
MPRPPRIDFPDAVYHVTSRGNGRADIFYSDDDRQRFLAQLAHHLGQCGVILYAFVLMQNHVHLLCRTPRANLSRFMQRLLSSYALYWRYMSSRAIGEHYRVGATAVAGNHARLTTRPDVLKVVARLAAQLRTKKRKC